MDRSAERTLNTPYAGLDLGADEADHGHGGHLVPVQVPQQPHHPPR